MADNPYTRSATVEVVELVPAKGQLPRCAAWLVSGLQCDRHGKYLQNDVPVCGVHLGRPGLVFMPESKR